MKAAVYRDDVLELLAAHGLAVMQDGRLGLDERAMVLKRLEPVVEAVSALPTLQPGAGEECDCQAPDADTGARLVSMECRVHNWNPCEPEPTTPHREEEANAKP